MVASLTRSLRVCLVDADKGVRCQVLRLIRYFLADDDAHRKSAALAAGSTGLTAAAPNTLSLACELERYNFGVFLSRSLERDGKHMWERMQVCTNQQSNFYYREISTYNISGFLFSVFACTIVVDLSWFSQKLLYLASTPPASSLSQTHRPSSACVA